MSRRGTEPGRSEPGRHRSAQRQEPGDQGCDGRQQHHTPREQKGDGQIAAEREPVDRRNPTGGKASRQYDGPEPRVPASGKQRSLVAGLQGLGRRHGGRLARREPCPGQPGQHAQGHVDGARPGLELERRLEPRKVPGPQVAAEHGQHPPGQTMADRHADHTAREPHKGALRHQPGEQAAAGETDGPQKGKLGAPPYHRERLRREDQEPAGQERNGRQHGQIHPVGPGQICRLSLRRLRCFDQHPGRQHAPAKRRARIPAPRLQRGADRCA